MSELARILNAAQPGEGVAEEELLPLVYQELRRLAASKLAGERPGQTLQPTALVHEARLRLGGADGGEWQNRAHFFAAAAEAMRRILVEKTAHRSHPEIRDRPAGFFHLCHGEPAGDIAREIPQEASSTLEQVTVNWSRQPLRGALRGLGNGTSQSILPVVVVVFRRTPGIAFSGVFLA